MASVTKNLSKAIIERSRLRDKFLKNKVKENRVLYAKKKRLLCLLP